MLSRLSDETIKFFLRRASTQPRSAPVSQRAVPCAAYSTPDSVLGFVLLLASLAGQSGIFSFYLANILGQLGTFVLMLIWFICYNLNLVYLPYSLGIIIKQNYFLPGTSATPPSLTIMCQRSEFFVVQSLCASVN